MDKLVLRSIVSVHGLWFLAAFSTASAQSLDELHKLALKEGGVVNFYATLAQLNAEKNFAGIREALSRHESQSCRRHR